MTKKLLLSIFVGLLAGTVSVFAQCTPNLPNTGIHSHIVPDTITNLPHAMVGVPYSSDIQFYVGTDTAVTTPITCNLHVTDYTLVSVTGLPTGFTYSTNPANGVFPGGTSDCMHAAGAAPTAGMVGTYPLVVNVTAHLSCNGFPITQQVAFNGYKIVIDPAGTVGINNLDVNKFELGQNIPNPATGTTSIPFTSPSNEKVELTVYNTIGQLVYNKSIDAKPGMNEISLRTSEFSDGVYIYMLRNSNTVLNHKMVVANK